MKDRAILISIFSFVLGIFISSFFYIAPLVSVWLLVAVIGIFIAEKIHRGSTSAVALPLLFLTFFVLGAFRYSIKDFHEITLPEREGIVVSEPEQKENATRFIFKSNNGEKALVSTDLYSEVNYGDKVEVEGKFERPGIIENDNGRNFDYGRYLSKDNIYFVANFARVEIISRGHGHPFKEALIRFKKSFVERTRQVFSEPYASLLSGLLVAGKDAMSKDLLAEFRRAGIVHIVVLSGYNITIIAEFLRRLFERVFLFSKLFTSPLLASGASIIGILLFVLMTGAEATVVRAALMVLTVIIAQMLGRRYSAPRALLLAGFLMLFLNPKILVFDPSFQLSFLATLALIYVVPIGEKYLSFITDKFTLRTTIATTIATQITVLPLLAYSIGDISLVSLPANILVLLIIPYTMLLGFISICLAYISAFVALPFAYVTHLLLAWILGVSSFFGNMKFASLAVMQFSFLFVIGAYVLLITLVWKKKNYLRSSAN